MSVLRTVRLRATLPATTFVVAFGGACFSHRAHSCCRRPAETGRGARARDRAGPYQRARSDVRVCTKHDRRRVGRTRSGAHSAAGWMVFFSFFFFLLVISTSTSAAGCRHDDAGSNPPPAAAADIVKFISLRVRGARRGTREPSLYIILCDFYN
ncbi:unnamed protein product [Aphis gossypii]|uniref:Uncharacterized protein n=1 Tax=Aphis gossypii TaxID=80765 RepID=A0A9P0J8M2_APHGO|nr:unnamed protein product [Aphis gossypii]